MVDNQFESVCVIQKQIGNTIYIVEIRKSDFESLPVEEKLLNIVIESITRNPSKLM